MRNIFRLLTFLLLPITCYSATSFEAIKPHANRSTSHRKTLPQNKDARALFIFLSTKSKGAIALAEDERALLGIADKYVVLLGMTMEEVFLNARGDERTIFLLPSEQGFGALLSRENGTQLFKFDLELKLVAAWTKEEKGLFTALPQTKARKLAESCISTWKAQSIE
jgi:hypothetical protein